jgi:Putative 2OG-Fe(II) oxygenase
MLIKPFDEVIYVESDVDMTSLSPHLKVFQSQIDIFLSQPYIHVQTGEQVGGVLTTAARQHALKSLQGYKELIDCLYPYFCIARDALWECDGDIKIRRAWLNVMNKDSAGLTHDHGEKCLVGVFYLNAPSNSGKFVIVNNKERRIKEEDIPLVDKHYIDISPYMFICHRNSVFHAVSKHTAEDSRVSVIIEATVE